MNRLRPSSPTRSDRRCGISLLEVLVASGILVIGLGSVAALLPAAGIRLSEAVTEDRSGALSANARSEFLSRGLAAGDIFANRDLAVAFGPGLETITSTGANRWFAAPTAEFQRRIDRTRGFWLEDDLVYTDTGGASGLSNSFFDAAAGPREFRERICWAGMLLPQSRPDGETPGGLTGAPATLAIAVLRKPPDPNLASRLITLACQATPNPQYSGKVLPPSGWFALASEDVRGVASLSTATRIDHEASIKRYLSPCSWVVLLPTNPGAAPLRLVQINSSWTLRGPGAAEDVSRRSSQLVLRLPDDLLGVASDGSTPFDPYREVSGGVQRVQVVGLANLVRLDQSQITLD